jgi:hypothetical protein
MTPEQIDATLSRCQAKLFPVNTSEKDDDTLNLLPLDHLTHTVLSICVPFLTKAVSDILYETYKKVRDSSKLKEAVREVKKNAAAIKFDRMEDAALSAEVKKRLADNGFTSEQADKLLPELFDIFREAGTAAGAPKREH